MKSTEQGERLQKILSRAGIASRRAAEELIREGRVKVNGKVVTTLGARADPARDRVQVDGKAARLGKLRYIAFHKPVGMVSTMSDPEGRPSIADAVRRLRTPVFPVGRLDFDSSGLVLLTNDGTLAQRLSHPRYGVEKTYRVKVRGHPTEKSLDRLRRGIRLSDGPTAPAEVRIEHGLQHKTRLRITIAEGRQRLVRRMFDAIGHPVDKLSRVSVGPLKLGALRVSEMRELTAREVEALQRQVGRSESGRATSVKPKPARSSRARSQDTGRASKRQRRS